LLKSFHIVFNKRVLLMINLYCLFLVIPNNDIRAAISLHRWQAVEMQHELRWQQGVVVDGAAAAVALVDGGG
jgi:hypothetical protein